MKITTTQLKQTIRRETQKLLNESQWKDINKEKVEKYAKQINNFITSTLNKTNVEEGFELIKLIRRHLNTYRQ